MVENSHSDIIKAILKREDPSGLGVVTNDPADTGGLTQFGLTKRDNPAEWADGKVTSDEAYHAYERKYLHGPGYAKIPSTHRRILGQLVDFGVNSGPGVATKKLQEILGVETDGVFGEETLAALIQRNDAEVNNKLVQARVKMICKIVKANPSQLKWLNGWVNRAFEFQV